MFTRYVRACYEQYQLDYAYRVYTNDTLQAIAENTTHLIGAKGVVDYGKSMPVRWFDVISPKQPDQAEKTLDSKSCVDIAKGIWAKIRGKKGRR